MIKLIGGKNMDKQYEQIQLMLGSTIEQAVNQLLSYKKEGKLACCKFNGVVLYSDTVTIDSAHQEIAGMSKAEFDKLMK